MMRTLYAGFSCPGNIRSSNQDKFYLNGIIQSHGTEIAKDICSLEKQQLFAICDGMGGMRYGEKAAEIVLESLAMIPIGTLARDWEIILAEINQKLLVWQKAEGISSGSTLAALLIDDGEAQIVNIGDSRVYLFSRGELSLLSVDDNLLALYTRDELSGMDNKQVQWARSRLLQYLGMADDEFEPEPHIRNIKLQSGDMFLLCSDGISSNLYNNQHLADLFRLGGTPEQFARRFIQESLNLGGDDNLTAIVVQV